MCFFPFLSESYALLNFLLIHLFSNSWKVSLAIFRPNTSSFKFRKHISEAICLH